MCLTLETSLGNELLISTEDRHPNQTLSQLLQSKRYKYETFVLTSPSSPGIKRGQWWPRRSGSCRSLSGSGSRPPTWRQSSRHRSASSGKVSLLLVLVGQRDWGGGDYRVCCCVCVCVCELKFYLCWFTAR